MDKEVVTAAKKIFKSACSELHAELAFIWISFVLASIILGSIVWLWYRNGPNKQVSLSFWFETLWKCRELIARLLEKDCSFDLKSRTPLRTLEEPFL